MMEWRSIPGLPLYEASSDGDIRRIGKSHPLKPYPTKGGYLICALSHGGIVTRHLVHQLVALIFIGPCPEGQEVNHIDHNRANCALANLEYLTHLENVHHAVTAARYEIGSDHWTKRTPDRIARGDNHGSHIKPETILRGERNGRAKIGEDEVRLIRHRRSNGDTLKDIAISFGISTSQTWNIVNCHQWAHIEDVA